MQIKGSDEKGGASWQERITRPMLFRFESGHVSGKFNGEWKIADMDNFLASRLFDDPEPKVSES